MAGCALFHLRIESADRNVDLVSIVALHAAD
jgi:hypothetical protein